MEYIFVATLITAGYYVQKKKPQNIELKSIDNARTSVFGSNMVGSADAQVNAHAQEAYQTDNDIISSHAGNKSHESSFTHSNMEPFFGSTITQNMNPMANDTLLQSMTGQGVYMPEKSTAPLFEPVSSESTTKDMLNAQYLENTRMMPSKQNQNVLPFEQVRVGKGFGGDHVLPTEGFQPLSDRQYELPKTIDELRSGGNQKDTYEGRMIAGKNRIDKRGKQPEMMKYLPERDYASGPERYLRTTGVETKTCKTLNRNSSRYVEENY